MDKATAQTITNEIRDAIADVLEKHGLEIATSRTTYGDTLDIKLSLQDAAPTGLDWNPRSEAALAFTRSARYYNLDPADLGREFTAAGRRHRIIGLRTRARTRPILTRCLDDGKQYAFSDDAVRNALRTEVR